MWFLLLAGVAAAASVGSTSGRHGATLPFAACQVRHLDQLKYLAKVMGFEVQVTNIPKVRVIHVLVWYVNLYSAEP